MKTRRLIVMILTVCMIVTYIPVTGYVYADETDTDRITETTPAELETAEDPSNAITEETSDTLETVSEDTTDTPDTDKKAEIRTLTGEAQREAFDEYVSSGEADNDIILNESGNYHNTYDLGEGTGAQVFFSYPVRYEDENGELVKIEPELVEVTEGRKGTDAKGYQYENKQGPYKTYIPDTLSEDTPILLENDKYSFTMAPVDIGIADTHAYVKDDKAVYGSEEDDIRLEYISQNDGLKENIILNERPETNEYTFALTFKNMYYTMDQESGGITFFDKETDEMVMGIGSPFMNDATEKAFSEDLEYEMTDPEEGEDTYTLKLKVSEKYLDDPERVYPITIDPTATWTGFSEVKDSYVQSAHPDTNFFLSSATMMKSGSGTNGINRTYIHILDLKAELIGANITSANFDIYETGNGRYGYSVRLHRITESWTNSSVTWNNRPDIVTSSYIDTNTTNGTANHKMSYDVTSWVRKVANEDIHNYGLCLRNYSETGTTFTEFFGSRTGTTAYRPKLTVIYTEDVPSIASSVTVSNDTSVSGNSFKVKWTGITANKLDQIQYKIAKCDSAWTVTNDNYVPYTRLTSGKSSGAVTVPGSTDLPIGYYKVYVRGVSKMGTSGSGKSAKIRIVSDKPTAPASVTVNSSSMFEGDTNTVSWTGVTADSLDHIEYKIASYDSNWNLQNKDYVPYTRIKGAVSSGSASIPNISTFPAGKYKIFIRGVSQSGINGTGKGAKITIKEDASPSIGNISFKKGNDTITSYTTTGEIVVDVTDITDDRSLTGRNASYTVKKGNVQVGSGTAALTEVSGKYKASFIVLSSLIEDTADYSVMVSVTDTNGNSSSLSKTLKIDNIKPTVNITSPANSDVLMGEVILSVDAADNKSLYDMKVVLTDQNQNETELTGSQGVYNFNTTLYPDGIYSIRAVAWDAAGNESDDTNSQDHIAQISVTLYNPPPTPTLELNRYYGSSQDGINVKWSYVSGDSSASKVSKLQIAVVSEGTAVSESDYSDFITTDADKSGNSVYYPAGLTEGRYDIYLRSVTASGNKCTPRSVTYVVDETEPDVTLDNLSQNGTEILDKIAIRGEITDDYLAGYKIYVSNDSGNSFSEIYSCDDVQNSNMVSGILGTADLSDDTAYPANSSVIVKIDARDEKGNHNIKLRTITKRTMVYDDPDFVIQKDQNGGIAITQDTALFRLKDLSDQTYDPNNPVWIIDGAKMTAGQTGTLDLSELSDYALHTISVYDKDQSGNVSYGTSTMETIIDGEDIVTLQESTVDINNGQFSLAANEATGELIADIYDTDEALSIKIDSTETIPEGASVAYYLSLNNGDYVHISKGTEILLTEAPFNADSILGNSIKLKVELDKGTAQSSPVVNDIMATVRKPISDTFSMNIMGGYEVSNVTAVPGLNYKILVSWQPPSGIGANGDISYEIYRSRSSDFPENDTQLVQSGITDNYWYDSYSIVNEGEHISGQTNVNDISGVTFYYRVKTVKATGSSARTSRGVDSPRADIVALDEYSKRLGIKEYWGYSELDVGAGTGYVEQSQGNFVYQETDAFVKGKVLDLEMTRTYNSMSTGTTALGIGWDFSFNPVLLEMFDGYGDSKGMLFKDGSGTIYTFLNIPDGEGVEEKTETIDGTEVVTSIETHYKSPYGVYIHLRKTESLDRDDTDQDGDTSEIADVNYVIETLSKDTYTFNRSSQITSYEDPSGNTVLYTYSEDGKLQEVENRNGRSEENISASGSTKRSRIQFSYYESSEGNAALIKYITMPNGQKIKYSYSSDNRLVSCSLYGAGDGTASSVTGTPVLSTVYEYSDPNDGSVSLITVKDPKGYESEIEYYRGNANNVGKCHKVIYPDSSCQEFIYDASDQTVEKTFVKRNNVIAEIGQSTVRFNADGNITYSEDIEGSVIETQYALGLEVREDSEVDQYTILDSGIIQHTTETVSTRTEYEDIPDNNTIASKIADTTGNVTSSTDIEGNTTTFQYSASGDANKENPTSIVTAPPEYADTMDGSVELSDEEAMHESFEYDSNGNPIKIADDDTGEEIIYAYDEYGQVISETMQITEDNVTTITQTSAYTYDDHGNLTSESSSNGSSPESTDRYMYDDFGRLTMEMNAGGYVTAHFYDALDREIRTVYYTDQYGSFNDVSVNDDSVSEEWQYDLNGNLIRERDRGGRETVYTYDNMDRITSRTVSLNGVNKTWTYAYSYDDVSLNFNSGSVTISNAYVTTVTDPDDVITSKTFEDKAGNTVKTIENGESTAFRYNRDGELIETYVVGMASGFTESDPTEGRTVISTYNKYGNVTANIINPGWNGESYYVSDDTIVYRFKYDTFGNLLEKKDPLGRCIRHSYDQNGRLISTNTPSSDPSVTGSQETLVDYDIPISNGNTATVVRNAALQYTETEEDPNGNVVRITDHGTINDSKKIEITYTYDAVGNIISETDGNGTRYYSYDDMDNLVRSVSEGNLSEPVDYSDYTYDCFGMMTSRKDYSDGSFDRIALYRYDELKRLRKYYEGEVEYQDDSLVDWTEYDYDIENNLTKIKYPSMPLIDYVAYNYGEYNRVSSVRIKEKNSQSSFLAREYTYDSNGRVSSLNDYLSSSDFLKKDYSYDQFGRCTEILVTDNGNAVDVLEHYVYTYDKCGNILTEEMMNAGAYDASGNGSYDLEHFSSDGTYHIKRYYTYNDLDELTGVQEKSISDTNTETLIHDISYTYDEIGNRITEEKDGILSTYIYDGDGLNLLETVVKETTEDMSLTTTYSYDNAGNIVEVVDEEKDSMTEYTYDSQGRLLTATVTAGTNDPVTTENIYDGAGYRIAKKVGNTMTHYFVVGGSVLFTWETTEGSNVSTVTSENAAGIDGQIFRTRRADGNWYVYSNDLRGSVTGIASTSGAYIQAVFYDMYGEPEVWGKGEIYNEIYYTGAIYDDTTGLYYLSSRYYDPATGRFTSMDSVRGNASDPLSLNLFIYCEGNPVKYTDTEGETPVVVIGAIIGGIIGGGSEIISQYMTYGKVKNWKGVAVRAVGGAASGALATCGFGWAAGTAFDAAINTTEEILYQKTTRKKVNAKEAASNIILSTGLSFGFNAPKGIKPPKKINAKDVFKSTTKKARAAKTKIKNGIKPANIKNGAKNLLHMH